MRRVTRRPLEEGPLLEEQETEGQRQLQGLLLRQLDTDADLQRCVAKRQCFAPAALYRPFGEQAAGVRSLSQFTALQDGERELAELREFGLSDAEVQLWRSRDGAAAGEQGHGVSAAPGVKQQRLQAIRDKMAERAELLARPQRFSASRPLTRKEMEIERSLFQGSERQGFLAALYHRDEETPEGRRGAPTSDPLDALYRDVLREGGLVPGPPRSPPAGDDHQSQSSPADDSRSDEPGGEPESRPATAATRPRPLAPAEVDLDQPIGRLRGGAGAELGPLTLRGGVQEPSEDEILGNRESDQGIRSIPRFRNYQPGEPSKVLCVKNLSRRASPAQLVALFSRFQAAGGPPPLYRLLTGRLRGQAFITLEDPETAQRALHLVHGYRLLGKPLVVEFGRERRKEEEEEEKGAG